MTSFQLLFHSFPMALSSLSQPCQEPSIAVQLLSFTDTFICRKRIIGPPTFRTWWADISTWASHLIMLHEHLTFPSFSAPSPSPKFAFLCRWCIHYLSARSRDRRLSDDPASATLAFISPSKVCIGHVSPEQSTPLRCQLLGSWDIGKKRNRLRNWRPSEQRIQRGHPFVFRFSQHQATRSIWHSKLRLLYTEQPR